MAPTTVVTDTSVIIKWLNQDNEGCLKQADAILRDVQSGKVTLLAPELAKYEVGNVLLFSKKLSQSQATLVLTYFYKLPISFIEDSEVLSRQTVAYVIDEGVTYYDASFMALAKQYGADLITDNIKHQGRATDIKVIPLKDYPD
jgi:predicted nucleic acid-binding protein